MGLNLQLPVYAQSANPSDPPRRAIGETGWRDLAGSESLGGESRSALLAALPEPGMRVHLSAPFTPAALGGMTIHPDNALQFDFLVHKGDKDLQGRQKTEEYQKLIKYFLASLTVPDENQWVNLSPYEKNRIIQDDFGRTQMGRDLLAQDYLLKEMTSSLIYPQEPLGQRFWNEVYRRAWSEYHTTVLPVNTFNKVWIVPDQAIVFESGNSAYILKSHLKVMLEEDYLALEKNLAPTRGHVKGDSPLLNSVKGTVPFNVSPSTLPNETALNVKAPQVNNLTHNLASQVMRTIILPALEKEVNEGAHFANLRQMFSAMILATWYKQALKESLLGKIYADQAKVKGVDQNPRNNKEIYQRYLKAFRKGVFNYIKEDPADVSLRGGGADEAISKGTTIARKYFSGGFEPLRTMVDDPAMLGKGPVVLRVTPQTLRALPRNILKDLREAPGPLDNVRVNLNPAGANNLGVDAAQTAQRVILFIEDEASLLTAFKRIYERRGFKVLTASRPEDIPTVIEEYKGLIDLIVSDTDNMEGKGGWIPHAKKAWADLKVTNSNVQLFAMSGTTSIERAKKQWGEDAKVFLAKPFKVEDFLREVDKWVPSRDSTVANAAMVTLVKHTALVVGDDPRVLDAKGEILRDQGFGVFKARSRDEIYGVMGRHGDEVDLLVILPSRGLNPAIAAALHDPNIKKNVNLQVLAVGTKDDMSSLEEAKIPKDGSLATVHTIQSFITVVKSLVPDKARAAAGGLAPDRAMRTGPRGILVVDDNRDVLDILELVLSSRGLKVFTAQNDQEADAIAAENGDQVDVILSDTDKEHVGAGDWIPVAKRIFDKIQAVNSHVQMFVMSGRLGTVERDDLHVKQQWETEHNVPVNAYIGKPIHSDFLLKEIDRLVPQREDYGNPAMAADAAQAARKGGIDFNAAHLNLQIKRNGKGIALPLAQQDMAQLTRIAGFVPQIIEIKPAINVPIINQLQHELQASGG